MVIERIISQMNPLEELLGLIVIIILGTYLVIHVPYKIGLWWKGEKPKDYGEDNLPF